MNTERGTLSADYSGKTHTNFLKLEAFPSIIHRVSAAFDKTQSAVQL